MKNLTVESWKDIAGYEGLYRISDLGRVKSIRKIHHKIMNPCPNTWGYFRVTLRKDGTSYTLTIHKAVTDAFLPKFAEKKEVNHKDGDKSNNRLDNLERVTRKENIQHSWKLKLRKSKITIMDVSMIKTLYREGLSQRKIAKQYDVSQARIHQVVTGKKSVRYAI